MDAKRPDIDAMRAMRSGYGGKPSDEVPEQFTDEQLLDMAHRGMGVGPGGYETFTGELAHDQQCLLRSFNRENIIEFVNLHGAENLPDIAQTPQMQAESEDYEDMTGGEVPEV